MPQQSAGGVFSPDIGRGLPSCPARGAPPGAGAGAPRRGPAEPRSSSPSADAGRGGRPPDRITVSGCQHETVGGIVCGEFVLDAENHGKPVYRKTAQVNGLSVALYFWDDRDGPAFRGWWFGPRVGGDQVWAHHPQGSARPPEAGWRVPYDGPVDPGLRLAARAPPSPSASPAPARGRERRRRRRKLRDARGAAAPGAGAGAAGAAAAPGGSAPAAGAPAPGAGAGAPAAGAPPAGAPPGPRGPPEPTAEERAAAERQREAQRRKEAEEGRRREQRAALAIRRVIQKVRVATPENFEELQRELGAILLQELESTGGQKQRMQEESDKGLEQARKRIEQVNEQHRRERERRDAEERRRAELEERCRRLAAELAGLVAEAEAGVERLAAAAAPLARPEGLRGAEAAEAARAAEEAGGEARRLTKACTDFILQRGAEMRDPGAAAPEEGEVKRTLAEMLQRINECTRASEAMVLQARSAREAAVRRAAAQQKLAELEARFEHYDKDADDMLSRREVLAYARGHFKFLLPEDALDSIWRHIVESGQRGVKMDGFQRLNVAIGVARECQRDAKRRIQREEGERVLRELKGGIQDKVREVAKAVDEADRSVARAEKQVQPLASRAKTTPVPEMLALADSTDAAIEEARAAVGEARRRIDGLGGGLEGRFAADLRAFLAAEAKQLELRMGRMDSRLSRARNLSHRFREQAARARAAELDRLRGAAARALRRGQRARGLSDEELFGLLDSDRDGEIGGEDLLGFLDAAERAAKELGPEAGLEGAAKDREGADGEEDAKEEAGASPDGNEEAVEKQEAPRDPGEVEHASEARRESLEEPSANGHAAPKSSASPQVPQDEDADVELTAEALLRLVSHMAEGSGATISREAFLCLVHASYKVVQETVLTSAACPEDGTALRSLEVGEALEALQGPLHDGSTGMPRVRVRALDGVEGWATLVGSGGATLLQPAGGLLRTLREAALEPALEPCEGEGGGEGGGGAGAGAGAGAARRLREGEVLEPRAWPRRAPRSGLLRLRARARGDGALGWLTLPEGAGGRALAEAL